MKKEVNFICLGLTVSKMLREAVERTMCERVSVYWNEKEINNKRNAVDLVEVYFEKTASMMKLKASVMYPVQAGLSNSTMPL